MIKIKALIRPLYILIKAFYVKIFLRSYVTQGPYKQYMGRIKIKIKALV